MDSTEAENAILKANNAALETENENLRKKITRLKQDIAARIGKDAEQILEYFNCCRSIRKTASKYGMEIEELYELIPQWDGRYEGLHAADDFEECRIIVIGRQECDKELESELEPEDLEFRTRHLDADDIKNIIGDYKNSELSLYELADRHNLKIDHLFQTLKHNGIIEKETDAKDYANFYKEHLGAREEWDGKSEIGFKGTKVQGAFGAKKWSTEGALPL
jgi:hypothetical protein